MANDGLSSNQNENFPKIEREQLYLEINKLLNGPSTPFFYNYKKKGVEVEGEREKTNTPLNP